MICKIKRKIKGLRKQQESKEEKGEIVPNSFKKQKSQYGTVFPERFPERKNKYFPGQRFQFLRKEIILETLKNLSSGKKCYSVKWGLVTFYSK